jgi:hypothetical protein
LVGHGHTGTLRNTSSHIGHFSAAMTNTPHPANIVGMNHPNADDYLKLFGRYDKDFGPAYLEPHDERYRLLFEQVCQLLMQASDFNLSMPQEFRRTAQQWTRGEAATVQHMGDPQNRHFMLSDLYDYVHLRKTMGDPGW